MLKTGGLFRIATDHPVYKRHVLRTMHQDAGFIWTAKCGEDWKREPADWVRTKYQQKAVREGRRPVFLTIGKFKPCESINAVQNIILKNIAISC